MEMKNINFYKISSEQTSDVYIGSTSRSLDVRLDEHRSDYKRWTDGKSKKYCTSYKIIKYPNHRIDLIKCIECIDKNHRLDFENELIDNDPNAINEARPGAILRAGGVKNYI